jgi:hypothetical protein
MHESYIQLEAPSPNPNDIIASNKEYFYLLRYSHSESAFSNCFSNLLECLVTLLESPLKC